MKKKFIDWERAANDRVPCFFWDNDCDVEDGHIPEVDRLGGYRHGQEKAFYAENAGNFKHCELVRTEDKEKYATYTWEGRESFIAFLRGGMLMKVRVTPEINEELQEIAFENGTFWCDGTETVCCTDKGFLYFNIHLTPNVISYGRSENEFLSEAAREYFPETDSFEAFKPKYRECRDFNEFRPFMGKLAICIRGSARNGFYSRNIGDVRVMDVFMVNGNDYDDETGRFWFKNYELIDPVNEYNIIGVKDEN